MDIRRPKSSNRLLHATSPSSPPVRNDELLRFRNPDFCPRAPDTRPQTNRSNRWPVISCLSRYSSLLNSPDGSGADSRTEANPRITALALQKTFQLQTLTSPLWKIIVFKPIASRSLTNLPFRSQ